VLLFSGFSPKYQTVTQGFVFLIHLKKMGDQPIITHKVKPILCHYCREE
jgi:hypothetical protein